MTISPRLRSVSVCLAAILAIVANGKGQTSNALSPASGPAATTAPASPATTGNESVNDYVACLLDAGQLASLRLGPTPKLMTQDRAKMTADAVSGKIQSLENADVIDSATAKKLTEQLSANKLVGSDPKQLLDKTRTALSTALVDTPADQKEKAADALTSTVQDAAATSFAAPNDVACSMSVLTYKETDEIFGRGVAQRYIAFQVVVRNLHPQQEFQLHDVELAVDTDPCGTKEKFDSGRDRLLARAVGLRNQSTDPRNRAVRVLDGITTVASAAIGFASADYAKGVGVFSALQPAVKEIFPDYTVDQLNRISDLTFSSSGQTRTVVPKNGVAMFVTFIPSRPLEQAWWIDQARQSPGGGPGSLACRNAAPGQANSPKPVTYKDWQPDALLEFRRHSFVIVAGVHTAAEDALAVQIDSLSCGNGADVLDLDPSKAKAEVDCTMKGSNLEKVSMLQLQDATDHTDPLAPTGNVSVAGGDSTTAAVTFKTTDLQALTGTIYNVLWLDANKIPKATELMIKIAPYPIVSDLNPKTLKLAGIVAGSLTLTGTNLQLVDGVQLVSDDGKTTIKLKVGANNGKPMTTLRVAYSPTDFATAIPGKYAVDVTVGGKVVVGASSQSLQLQ